jgi:hypothetical protein
MGWIRKVRQIIDPKGGAAAEAREPASSIAAVARDAAQAPEFVAAAP